MGTIELKLFHFWGSIHNTISQFSVSDPGFPRGGGANPPGAGANIEFCQIFPKNCMKLEEFGPGRGHIQKFTMQIRP